MAVLSSLYYLAFSWCCRCACTSRILLALAFAWENYGDGPRETVVKRAFPPNPPQLFQQTATCAPPRASPAPPASGGTTRYTHPPSKPAFANPADMPLTVLVVIWKEKLEGLTPRKANFSRVLRFYSPQRSWQHCQQLGDLLRVAGGVGSDAAAEAVYGRAKAMQLRDKRSRLIATPDCNSHVEADNGNHTFSPPRQICRAPFTARAKILAGNHHSRGLPSPYIQTR